MSGLIFGNMRRKKALLLPVLAMLSPLAAYSSFVESATVNGELLGSTQPGFFQSVTQSSPVDISGGFCAGGVCSGPSAFDFASAKVTLGSIKLLAIDLGGPDPQNKLVGATSSSKGAFSDSFTVTAPGIAAGTAGTLTYNVSLNGTMVGGPAVSGSWDWQLLSEWNSIQVMNQQGDLTSGGVLLGENPSGIFSVTVPFIYGQLDNVYVQLSTDVHSSLVATLPSSADLSHSLYWDGITNVTANGSPVGSFLVTSDSGTDWSQSFVPSTAAAPEPGTLGVIGLLLGALWLARGKSREDGHRS